MLLSKKEEVGHVQIKGALSRISHKNARSSCGLFGLWGVADMWFIRLFTRGLNYCNVLVVHKRPKAG